MVDSVRKSGVKKARPTDGSTSNRQKTDSAEVKDDSTPQQDGREAAADDRVIKRKKKKKSRKKDKDESSSSSSSDSSASSDRSTGDRDTSAKTKSAVDVAVEKELAKAVTSTPIIDKTIFTTLSSDPARAFIEFEAALFLHGCE